MGERIFTVVLFGFIGWLLLGVVGCAVRVQGGYKTHGEPLQSFGSEGVVGFIVGALAPFVIPAIEKKKAQEKAKREGTQRWSEETQRWRKDPNALAKVAFDIASRKGTSTALKQSPGSRSGSGDRYFKVEHPSAYKYSDESIQIIACGVPTVWFENRATGEVYLFEDWERPNRRYRQRWDYYVTIRFRGSLVIDTLGQEVRNLDRDNEWEDYLRRLIEAKK